MSVQIVEIEVNQAIASAHMLNMRNACGQMLVEYPLTGRKFYDTVQAAARLPFAPFFDVLSIEGENVTLHTGWGKTRTVTLSSLTLRARSHHGQGATIRG